MAGLDSYLVSLGVKGQDVVLSTMDKIRKKGDTLTKKKTVIDFAATMSKNGAGALKSILKGVATLPFEKKKTDEEKKAEKEKEQNNLKFSEGAKKFGEGVKNFAGAAATLDPTAVIQSVNSAIGTSLSGISILGVSLGRLPEGIAALSNSMLSMANNAVTMAKQSTAAYNQLAARNAAREFYGSNVQAGEQMSKNDIAMFVDAISGSMGKIQKPLADEINKLVSTKDTRALSRAAAGDWESTGTDKGWLLQQMANGMQGLPPSIKQKFNAALLQQNAGEIQGYTTTQYGAQKNAATLANMEEAQTQKMYESAAPGGTLDPRLTKMMTSLNSMQLTLYDTGIGFAKAVGSAITAIQGIPAAVDSMTNALKEFKNNPSYKEAKHVISNLRIPGQ